MEYPFVFMRADGHIAPRQLCLAIVGDIQRRIRMNEELMTIKQTVLNESGWEYGEDQSRDEDWISFDLRLPPRQVAGKPTDRKLTLIVWNDERCQLSISEWDDSPIEYKTTTLSIGGSIDQIVEFCKHLKSVIPEQN